MVPLQVGLGDGSTPTVPFTFYPHCAAISTCYPDHQDVLAATFSLVKNSPSSVSWLQSLGQSLARYVPGLYWQVHQVVFSRMYLRGAQEVLCEVKTMSQLMEEEGISHVALLKVNVERGEMDVLRGIEDQDWMKVDQVSVQIHDIGDRIHEGQALLEGQGFEAWVEQEPRFKGSPIFMLYGKRKEDGKI